MDTAPPVPPAPNPPDKSKLPPRPEFSLLPYPAITFMSPPDDPDDVASPAEI